MTTRKHLMAAMMGLAVASLPTAGEARQWDFQRDHSPDKWRATWRRRAYKAQRAANRQRRKLLQD